VPDVRAAGGLVVRRGADGEPELLLVHRPHRRDWSFPKGKAEAGERDEECALREVEEEARVRCRLGPYVGETRYDVDGGPKRVAYFLMETDDEPRPGDKTDEVRWASIPDALQLLTWERDRELLRAAAGLIERDAAGRRGVAPS
jgi:8-oxo-dGTP pyrophosphatase MutT (NUDIX family)